MVGDFWWTGRADERLWMEITRRDDLGSDLGAPLEARGGSNSPGYALMNEVAEGDVVIHYNSVTRSIDGVSRVSGPPYYERIWWAARGTYARAAGEKPSWKPGIWIPLSDFRSLTPPISRETIVDRREAILGLQVSLQKREGEPLYFPFSKAYGISAYQSYLAKFPSDLLQLLPELKGPVDSLLGESNGATLPSEVEEASSQFAAAAGRRRRNAFTQGRQTDPAIRAAIEAHAMNLALEHYLNLGEVVDTSLTESYDYAVDIEGVEWHIEVKGTTSAGESVLLTPNEVSHALAYEHVALFVVSDIQIENREGGPVAIGGRIQVHHPWTLDTAYLSATGYSYEIPSEGLTAK